MSGQVEDDGAEKAVVLVALLLPAPGSSSGSQVGQGQFFLGQGQRIGGSEGLNASTQHIRRPHPGLN